MNSEKQSLMKNNTWQIVEKTKDKKIIHVQWIIKRKIGNTYEARLVVRGFQQKKYIDNVYSPVRKWKR